MEVRPLSQSARAIVNPKGDDASQLSMTLPSSARGSAPLSARTMRVPDVADPQKQMLAYAESQFFSSHAEKEMVHSARYKYPQKKQTKKPASDPITGEESETIQRRIMGFGLGFEKIFQTTSIKLPVSSYTVFAEIHSSHDHQIYSRCFNGLHTVFDLKKWIYEQLLVPMNAYDLSYAEPGKAVLTDQLRLLTTQDSLETRTFATTRSVHGLYRGIPGVHSISDVGVTRLYARLKCRTCGDLVSGLQTCRKYISFGHLQAPPDVPWLGAEYKDDVTKKNQSSKDATGRGAFTSQQIPRLALEHHDEANQVGDPTIEDCWHRPDAKKNCLYHTRGLEIFEAARAHTPHAPMARLFISIGKAPTKMLKMAQNVLTSRTVSEISY
mmetsp:Transcript_86480/g.245233  ORF Transcript_86480/g.245233 Transcript_86480/m.245233 type:complete len:382 (+) Transcript_86480:97-1242(+)